MKQERLRCLLISDFALDNFQGLLENDEDLPQLNATLAPYGQVIPVLINDEHEIWKNEYDFAIIWTQPQAMFNVFKDAIHYSLVNTEDVFNEVDHFLKAISVLSTRVKNVFVPTWGMPPYHRGFGFVDMMPNIGISSLLMRINLRLAEYCSAIPNVFVLNTQKWIEQVGSKSFNPKLWYMGKIPFANEIFLEAAKDIKAAIQGINGQAKKLIIVDLDDTLWGGIVGDDGWENLRLGGHDALGESYVDFQRALKSFTNRGILLGIVSKNEESIALEAIEKHPEMVLKRDDFAGWRINWNDKAQNIVFLVEEINIGLQSVVFIDDNPVERSRVRDTLPEVFVPGMPQDKMLYTKTLLGLRCFDTPTISQEDTQRTRMYVSERKRKSLQDSVGSMNEWLKGLQTVIRIEKLKPSNLERTVQLLNKTNQMNLTTRRLTDKELLEWETQDNHWLRTLRVSDKFGDSGLTGIISLSIDRQSARIIDFVLSCRVMGRRIEEIMVHHAIDYVKSLGLKQVEAYYKETKKNKPCFEFWKRSGFYFVEKDYCFYWDNTQEYPQYDFAEVIIEE